MIVECHTTKDDTSMVSYYYIKNVPLIIERLVTSCVLGGKYQDSIKILEVENKVISNLVLIWVWVILLCSYYLEKN